MVDLLVGRKRDEMKKQIPVRNPSIDFSFRQLEIFVKVVELGSFTKAADAVFLAQASVSERIATLERMIGTRLLDRLGRQVLLTKAGELLYKHAVVLLKQKVAVRLEMQDFLGLRGGELCMGGSTVPGEYILPKIIGRFRREYPLVSVNLTVADTREIEDRVLKGKIELGVVGSKSLHRSLSCREMWQDDLVLAVPSEHPWAGKNDVSVEEIFQEPFIIREEGSGTLRIIEDYLCPGSRGIDSLNVVARLSTSTAVKEGIKGGLGVSILSSRALDTELKAGILKALKVRDLPMSRSFYLVRDKRRSSSPLCRAMFDFLLTTSGRQK